MEKNEKKESSNIFNEIPNLNYHEVAPAIDDSEFFKVVDSRRSVRVYTEAKIPDEVMQKSFDAALKAPNSSNLQCWEFYWVKTAEKKARLVEACMGQQAAKTAAELVVFVGRTKRWQWARTEMLKALDHQANTAKIRVPKSAKLYYEKLVPITYGQGIFGILGLLKKIIVHSLGIFKVMPREPASLSEMKIWATKSTSLACENYMLAMRAQGYDTCPMEGFDSCRVKKILGLPSDAVVVMVISAGKRSERGIYGPQIRFERKNFIKEV